MLSISGIEVIRGYHGVLPASSNPGLATDAVPPEKLELTYGDSLRVNTGFGYRGPAGKAILYGAIGRRGRTFDEILKGEAEIDLPSSATFTPLSRSVVINITSGIKPDTNYDIYCKLLGHLDAGLPEVDDVIDIIGIPPSYTLILDTTYPYAYVYDGEVEDVIATFKTDPFSSSAWAGKKFADELEKRVKAEGGRVLEVRVYVDITPLLWKDFIVRVITTPLGLTTSLGAPIATGAIQIPVAVTILIIALAIIAVIVVATLMWERIMRTFKRKALSEEIKITWSRDSLISVIGDFEEKLDRPLTPLADLEVKTDQELRTYCNELAEVISPPGFTWMPWVIGGVAILAAGGIAMAARKKK